MHCAMTYLPYLFVRLLVRPSIRQVISCVLNENDTTLWFCFRTTSVDPTWYHNCLSHTHTRKNVVINVVKINPLE